MQKFTHLDSQGHARMVDISHKTDTAREAIASGRITLSEEALRQIRENSNKKGDVLSVARVAGIQGAKKCSDLIPLCHLLPLSQVTIDFSFEPDALVITATCRVTAKTGVEMEALTACSIAALTIYDMCKAVDKQMVIGDIHLLKKTGGQSHKRPEDRATSADSERFSRS